MQFCIQIVLIQISIEFITTVEIWIRAQSFAEQYE